MLSLLYFDHCNCLRTSLRLHTGPVSCSDILFTSKNWLKDHRYNKRGNLDTVNNELYISSSLEVILGQIKNGGDGYVRWEVGVDQERVRCLCCGYN